MLGTYESVRGLQKDATLPRWQQELQGIKINPESFYKEGDRNLATPELKRGWLSRDGRSIDEVAHDLSNYGIEVTNQDIVDFMLENPSGRVRQKSSELDALGQRFSELATKAAGVKIGKPDSPTGKLFIENMRTSNNMEQLRNQINDAQRAEEEVLRSMAEQRDAERENNKIENSGRKLSPEEADALLSAMEANAEVAPELELTPENWENEFGEDGKVQTSIGEVKMGENQLAKLFLKKRENEFGMIKPTLEKPDVIIEEKSTENEGGNVNRETSYLFAKTFISGGEKMRFFTSVTVSRDGMEVVVSNHLLRENQMVDKLKKGNLLYKSTSLNVSGQTSLEQGSSAESGASFTDKDSEVSRENQEEINNVDKIRDAEREVELNPTDAQKEAGNYKKGHVRIDGYDVTIENPKGSERSGTDVNGKPWSIVMNNTYGYIRGTKGVDGDHIDVFLSDSPDSGNVYVVDQIKEDGSFDEHKVMYGFDSIDEARDAYLSNYSPGWKGLGAITEVPKDEFKKWIDSSKRKTKPFYEYRNVKTEDSQIDSPLFREVEAAKEVSSFAQKHGFDESDVRKYADSMRIGNLGGASYAIANMRRKVRLDNSGKSLGEFVKIFEPIKAELYEKFGNSFGRCAGKADIYETVGTSRSSEKARHFYK